MVDNYLFPGLYNVIAKYDFIDVLESRKPDWALHFIIF